MKKFFAALIGGLLLSGTASAEIVTYEGVGQYVMSDFETPDVAKLRAKQRAEASAQEKAGVFVKSNTKVVNLKLESEEVEVMTAGIMKVHSVNYDTQLDSSGILYTAKVLVDIDTDEIDKWLQKSVVEKEQLIEQNKTLQKTLAEQEKQLAELKAKVENLENANLNSNPAEITFDKMRLTGEFNKSKNVFLSNEKLKQGLAAHSRGDFYNAINFYTEALNLNSENVAALTWRGNAFGSLNYFQNAVNDLTHAVQLDNKNSIAYVGLGIAYYSMAEYNFAISALNSAIQLDINNGKAYYTRAACYRALGKFQEARQDDYSVQRLGYKLQ